MYWIIELGECIEILEIVDTCGWLHRMVPSPRVTSQSFWESWRQWRTAPNQLHANPSSHSRVTRNPRHSIWNFNFWGHRSYVEDSGQEAFEFFRPQNHRCLWCFKCQKFQALLGALFTGDFIKVLTRWRQSHLIIRVPAIMSDWFTYLQSSHSYRFISPRFSRSFDASEQDGVRAHGARWESKLKPSLDEWQQVANVESRDMHWFLTTCDLPNNAYHGISWWYCIINTNYNI